MAGGPFPLHSEWFSHSLYRYVLGVGLFDIFWGLCYLDKHIPSFPYGTLRRLLVHDESRIDRPKGLSLRV